MFERCKAKTADQLEGELQRINTSFNAGRFDTLMGEVYDVLDTALEHAEVEREYGKVKKSKDTELSYQKRLDFLRALKMLKQHWKPNK